MRKVSIFFLFIMLTLTLTSCTSGDKNVSERKTLVLTGLSKVAFTSAEGTELGKKINHPAYEKYYIDKPEALQELAKSIKYLVKTTDNPNNIAYYATFWTPSGAIEMWFGFPEKIWLKEPDGTMQCWAVEGEFANIISRVLKNVPVKFKGEIGLHGITHQSVLFVFDKPYSLYIAPQDAAKIEDSLGKSALIVGKPFVNNNEDYIEVVYAEILPSVKLQGELKIWLSGDLALLTEKGEYYQLRLNNIQKAALKYEVNKRIKITGVIHGPDSYYTRKNISVYYYRKYRAKLPSPNGSLVE